MRKRIFTVIATILSLAGFFQIPALADETVWSDDAVPTGAISGGYGGDSWSWISSNPAPFSGSTSHQSALIAGLHQHYFDWAQQTLPVNSGDVLFAYVYLDPANPPGEVMLEWNDGTWEHRAYWGGNNISNGTDGTVSRRYVGALPAAGQWARLEVPASQVGLEGSTLRAMSFTLFDGRASWDKAGKSTAGSTTTNSSGSTNSTSGISTPGSGGTNSSAASATNALLSGTSIIDNVALQMPKPGDHGLHILTPTVLELKYINTKVKSAATVPDWNLVNNSLFTSLPTSAFTVTANGQAVAVVTAGFKRRPLYAPLVNYDLRIENSLYLQLASPISDNQTVVVKNTDGSLWNSGTTYSAIVDPLRYSPAIHVNQEGYMPGYPKKAMIGYYAGSMGELNVISSAGFKLVDANTGSTVFTGSLVQRADVGYLYTPTPYQKVYEADFTGFNTPGQYKLVVPGMGASLPFNITDGVAMDFARTYALGLYHQRCGTDNSLPFTRFTHDACHTAAAAVPTSYAAFPYTWNTISNYSQVTNPDSPVQSAPKLTGPNAQLFPFVKTGTIDVSGGHHDAGDYSKYTMNSVALIHYLTLAADSFQGVAALDNLGIPESGDGISDVLQEAKWEADFLAKMQDSDGGFYFLVYPQTREYEGNVLPDHGDPQLVWPKTSTATASSVAALAEIGSSPAFKRAYPQVAAMYLQKAVLGWQFLTNAINAHGLTGIYQKITHYGDDFGDRDELVWAAAAMFAATGDAQYQQKLFEWFPDPTNAATFRWGWWRLYQSYGNAVCSYAFAVR
ncbi:MAG TPA: glycoside hydrolase family 9 protein, partial [Candidatus Paceibacterota bacterium]|nr:glycoside hydrolase family 9 protein [Candidatus Paceibacterota bacterium]